MAKLIELAVDGIRSNYSEIRTIRANVMQVMINPGVWEPTTITIERDDGTTLTASEHPRSEMDCRLKISGDKLRFEIVRTTFGYSEIRAFSSGQWTQFVPASLANPPQAWIKPTADLGSMLPVDAREFGSMDIKEPVLSQLRIGVVSSAELQERPNRAPLLRMEIPEPSGGIYHWEFDGDFGYLPTRVVAVRKDGRIASVHGCEYSRFDVEGRSVFFPRTVRRTYGGYTAEDKKNLARVGGLPQRLTTDYTDVVINEPVPDSAFVIEFPPGTLIMGGGGDDLGAPEQRDSF